VTSPLHDDAHRARARAGALGKDIGRATPSGSQGNAAFCGQNTTSHPVVGEFLTLVPTGVMGPETEGSAGVFTVGSQTVEALLLGPGVPAIGDYLVARRVSNRWVVEIGSGESVPCPEGHPTVANVTAYNPCTSGAYSGLNVTVKFAGSTVATGTTSSGGTYSYSPTTTGVYSFYFSIGGDCAGASPYVVTIRSLCNETVAVILYVCDINVTAQLTDCGTGDPIDGALGAFGQPDIVNGITCTGAGFGIPLSLGTAIETDLGSGSWLAQWCFVWSYVGFGDPDFSCDCDDNSGSVWGTPADAVVMTIVPITAGAGGVGIGNLGLITSGSYLSGCTQFDATACGDSVSVDVPCLKVAAPWSGVVYGGSPVAPGCTSATGPSFSACDPTGILIKSTLYMNFHDSTFGAPPSIFGSFEGVSVAVNWVAGTTMWTSGLLGPDGTTCSDGVTPVANAEIVFDASIFQATYIKYGPTGLECGPPIGAPFSGDSIPTPTDLGAAFLAAPYGRDVEVVGSE
jgi:hypothetical protein